MSNAANDLLQQMQKDPDGSEAKRAPGAPIDKNEFYVKLRILKLRRQQVVFAMALSFLTFIVLIARDFRKDRAWWLTGLPIAAVGFMIALIPPSEEWEYKPWQARARQYERNQINR